MRTLIFVPYDDPQIISFFRAGVRHEYRLIFLAEDISNQVMSEEVTFVAMDPRESATLEEYVAVAIQMAREASVEKNCNKVVCFLGYPDFIEIIATEVSLTVPFGDFFLEHLYDSYETGEQGFLYELQKIDDVTINLHQLSKSEFDLMPCAN